MEKNGKAHLLLMLLFSGALSAFAYSMGRQSGERDTRDLFERTAFERRMAVIIDSDHDLYMGDENHEGDTHPYVGPTPGNESAADGHAIRDVESITSNTSSLP